MADEAPLEIEARSSRRDVAASNLDDLGRKVSNVNVWYEVGSCNVTTTYRLISVVRLYICGFAMGGRGGMGRAMMDEGEKEGDGEGDRCVWRAGGRAKPSRQGPTPINAQLSKSTPPFHVSPLPTTEPPLPLQLFTPKEFCKSPLIWSNGGGPGIRPDLRRSSAKVHGTAGG